MADQDGARVRLTAVVKRFSLGGGQVLTAIKKVSFEIGPASVTALSGPSGSGKSTLLNLIGAIEQADEGTIEVNGLDLTGRSRRDLAAYRRTVGFVFQRYNLLPALTALDNVISPVLPYKPGYDHAETSSGTAGRGRPGRPGQRSAVTVVRRPATAGRDRACPDELAAAAAGRRATWEPGLADRRRAH